ncbi:hypothetical protein ACLK1T_26060 [Escherichia coli]
MTKVNVGGDRLLASSAVRQTARQGLRVAVATIGAVLPGDSKLKRRNLRGGRRPEGTPALLL